MYAEFKLSGQDKMALNRVAVMTLCTIMVRRALRLTVDWEYDGERWTERFVAPASHFPAEVDRCGGRRLAAACLGLLENSDWPLVRC